MGLIGFLLTLPVSAPLAGVIFVAEKLTEQALEEMLDEDRVQQRLMELELRREFGEIDPEEYARREDELMESLEAIRKFKEEQEKGD